MAAAGDFLPAGEDDCAGSVRLISQDPEEGAALRQAAAKRQVASACRSGPDPAALLDEAVGATPPCVIALCLSAVTDGAALLRALASARRAGRHVVALLSGPGETAGPAPGIPAARLHAALLEDAGAILAESHRELLDAALFLASLGRAGLPAGGRIAILTGGGGGGVIAADLCGRHRLEVPPLEAATRAALAPLVPAIASTANPVDLTPEMFNEKFYDRFPQVLAVVAADPGVDAVFLPTTFNAPRGNPVAAQVLADFHARSPKPVLIGAGTPPDMLPVFAAGGVAPIADTAAAVAILARLVARPALPETIGPCAASGPAWPAQAAAALPLLLAEAGFTVETPRETGPDAAAVAAAAESLGFPMVLSARPGERSIGDIWDAADLAAARARLLAAGAEGFVLRRDLPSAWPLRLLGYRDAAFGPVLALGAGGVQARVLDAMVFARAPLDAAGALAWLQRSRAVAHAWRMERALDLTQVAQGVAGFSRLVATAPWPAFLLALDPVLPEPGALRVLGARLSIAPDQGSRS